MQRSGGHPASAEGLPEALRHEDETESAWRKSAAGMEQARAARRIKLRRLLRAIRRERGITQIQLAERLGVPQPMISRYEKGERQVDFVEVEAICEAVGMSLKSFCRRWESTPEDFEGE